MALPFFLILLLHHNQNLISPAGTLPHPPPPTPQFKPGIAVIVALLTTIFSVTFLLLLYMKHCKREANYVGTSYQTTPLGRNSGVDRKVIESLPMFRFSSLTGQKDGLECAVCLNRFDADEVLRLLPKCKHAFHVECVDTWLDAHSTCPLCRYRVEPEDVLLLDARIQYNPGRGAATATPRSSSNQGKEHIINPRISGRHSSAGERGTAALEIISENPPAGRVSLDSWHTSRRKSGNPKTENPESNIGALNRKIRKDGQLLSAAQKDNNHRRLEHRIVISSGEDLEAETERRRWSDAQAAEILYLKSEMMITKGGRGVNNERSVSEITGVSRYVSNNGGGQEERAVRRWLDWISSQSQFQSHSLN